MPDSEGKLSSDDKKTVIAHLSRPGFVMEPICPLCGKSEWFVADDLVMPPNFSPGRGLNLGGPGYPLVMIISTSCGYTRFLNAVYVGLVPPSKPPESAQTEEQKGGDHA